MPVELSIDTIGLWRATDFWLYLSRDVWTGLSVRGAAAALESRARQVEGDQMPKKPKPRRAASLPNTQPAAKAVRENDPQLTRAYVLEKLTTALHILVTGKGDARRRVADAMFACHTLRTKDFPKKLQKDWTWIERETTKFGPYRNRWSAEREVVIGSVDNTMLNRKNATASKIAKRFWDVYWAVSHNTQYE
jgi:hypothetical protein